MHERADRDRTEPPTAVGYIDPDIGDTPGGAPGGNPLHGMPNSRGAAHTVPSDDERLSRYAVALDLHSFRLASTYWQRFVLRVMAVADAEQADLRAEVAHWKHHAWEAGEGFKRAIEDAVRAGIRRRAAEAKVARVEALADEWERRGEWAQSAGLPPFDWAKPIRAALAGPVEAEATENPALAELREFADMLATYHRGRKIDADPVIDKIRALTGATEGGA